MPDVTLRTPSATVVIDNDRGGRIAALTVAGMQVIVPFDGGVSKLHWGSYPMVPFAGRIRDGLIRYDGVDHQLDVDFPPHSIHGVVLEDAWRIVHADDTVCEMHIDLSTTKKAWPFGGTASQRFELLDGALVQTLGVTAGEQAMPATVGWHPWFLRDIGRGAPLEFDVDLSGARRYRKDDVGSPTGELVRPGTGPWDDCFIGIGDLTLRWPGALEVLVTHDCSHYVIFDEPDHAICVEPQSGPPDPHLHDFDASRLEPFASMERTTTWTWTVL